MPHTVTSIISYFYIGTAKLSLDISKPDVLIIHVLGGVATVIFWQCRTEVAVTSESWKRFQFVAKLGRRCYRLNGSLVLKQLGLLIFALLLFLHAILI